MADRCSFGGVTKPNGNCTAPGDDGLPVQCVGEWSRDKHDYLRRFLSASRAARMKFLPPRGPGGAAFIDLFAGPGRARVRETGDLIDGSPLIALRQEVGFTDVVLCELDSENSEALAERCSVFRSRVTVVRGDCNERLDAIAAGICEFGLNVALIDPFKLEPLSFETIARLARFKRMDLLIFFPWSEIKRNLFQNPQKYGPWVDRFLGTDGWQSRVRMSADVPRLIDVLRDQLASLGYTGERTRTVPIRLAGGQHLYDIVCASKDELGDRLWQSVTGIGPHGQRKMF